MMRVILFGIGAVLVGIAVVMTTMNFKAKGDSPRPESAVLTAAVLPLAEADPAVPAAASPAGIDWMIDRGGALVPEPDVAAFLRQDRFAETRRVEIVRPAPLGDLLTAGETLPAPAFLQAFADIRASALAGAECDALRAAFAADCAVADAGVVEDSVDAEAGTARFRFVLSYRLKAEAAPLPDPRTLAFRTDRLGLEDAASDPARADAAAWRDHALAAAEAACVPVMAEHGNCRIMALDVDWTSAEDLSAGVRIGWLEPLPKGIHIVGEPGG